MTTRSVSVLALLLAACAAWETTTPSSAPPAESPVPSHYAPAQPEPPPMVEPTPTPEPEPTAEPEPTPQPTPQPTPEPTPIATSRVTKLQVAIASVQLLEDCPDPAPQPAQAPVTAAPGAASRADEAMQGPSARSSMKRPGGDLRRMCSQSTVQLSVQADGVQAFKIESVRVLAANGKQAVGSTRLRAPTTWDDATGTYGAWQEYTAAGKDLKVSYKMGDLEFTSAAERLSGDKFNTYTGPFLLEITVSAGGKRKTVRSPEFMREPPHVMVT